MEKEFSLYIVSTPIGNLKDMTYRAVECLQQVDFILCEDTRQTIKLLNHFDIHKKLVSYHKFNEFEISDNIINQLKDGQTAALVSDAGTPLISDPGSILVKKIIENELEFCVIPGANALLPSVIMSGFNSRTFSFFGFLDGKKSEKMTTLKRAFDNDMISVFYVSPHELKNVLSFIAEINDDRMLCVCKELTKIHETTYRGSASRILSILPENIKGEYTLVIDKNDRISDDKAYTDDELQSIFSAYYDKTASKKEALKLTCAETGLAKNHLYDLLMKN